MNAHEQHLIEADKRACQQSKALNPSAARHTLVGMCVSIKTEKYTTAYYGRGTIGTIVIAGAMGGEVKIKLDNGRAIWLSGVSELWQHFNEVAELSQTPESVWQS